jgi:hypothetical protein
MNGTCFTSLASPIERVRYYQAFGANPDVRDQLLQMASNLTGTKHQTLSEAISEIEMKIAKLRTGA